MNYSDSIKAILLAAINELSKIPENYAVKPGVDFIRNRKLGFKDYMLMFLTMEAACILDSFITVNMNSGPAMVLPVIFSLTLRIRIPILSLMVNLPEALIRSISMPCFPCLTSALLIS